MPKSPYTVELTWNLVAEPTFRHYNLYCGRKADFAVAQDTLVASPDAAGYYDWALKPGETVYYRVTRVDRGGNESPPSTAVKVDMPPVKRELLEITPAAQVKFQIPQAGTYVVWLKLRSGKQSGQYMNLKMDNAPAVTWSCVFDGLGENAWFTYDQWGRFPLTEGAHTLSIENRTKAVDRSFSA